MDISKVASSQHSNAATLERNYLGWLSGTSGCSVWLWGCSKVPRGTGMNVLWGYLEGN